MKTKIIKIVVYVLAAIALCVSLGFNIYLGYDRHNIVTTRDNALEAQAGAEMRYEALEADYNAMTEDLTVLQTNISERDATIENLTKENNSLKNQVNELKKN